MHLITLLDWETDQIRTVLGLAHELKARPRAGALEPTLARKTLALMFEKSSMRTRVSFEVAMTQLGGHVTYLSRDDVNLGVREPIKDGARVLSRYVDVIAARVYDHATVEQLAEYATVPVINASQRRLPPLPGAGGHDDHRGTLRRAGERRPTSATATTRAAHWPSSAASWATPSPSPCRRPTPSARTSSARWTASARSTTRRGGRGRGRALHGRLDQHGPGGRVRETAPGLRRLLRGLRPAGARLRRAALSCTTCPRTAARR